MATCCLVFSPFLDGNHVATGSEDSAIYLYSYLEKTDGTFVWEFNGKLKVQFVTLINAKMLENAYLH